MFTAKDVMALREMSGAGMMDCKRALVETDGDMDKAMEYLREKSLAATAKKASRIAAEGIVDSYIHMGGKIGVLLEVNCETDFVAKTDDFKQYSSCHYGVLLSPRRGFTRSYNFPYLLYHKSAPHKGE